MLYERLPLPKCAADEIESDRINAAVDETEAKADYPECVPVFIIVLM